MRSGATCRTAISCSARRSSPPAGATSCIARRSISDQPPEILAGAGDDDLVVAFPGEAAVEGPRRPVPLPEDMGVSAGQGGAPGHEVPRHPLPARRLDDEQVGEKEDLA